MVSVCLGLTSFVHEVWFTSGERPFVLFASLALIGVVPPALALDWVRRGQ